jgi:hypothetical protein
MPRGSKPGERSGGRANGAPNRLTLERERGLANAVGADAYAGKLGKEMMIAAMREFNALARRYHPDGREPDEAKFVTYLKLASDTGRDLAPFQSPKVAPTALRSDQENPESEPVSAEQLRQEILADIAELGISLTDDEPTEPRRKSASARPIPTGGATMGEDDRRSGLDRRAGQDRRSGVDTRSDEDKRLQGERRSNPDRRCGLDRRSGPMLDDLKRP